MGDHDYFEYVQDHRRVINYIEGILQQAPIIIDTSVVPTLENHLTGSKPDSLVIANYSSFMGAFNRWLDDSENLVIVPQVQKEIDHRLGKAAELANKRKNGEAGGSLAEYEQLVRDAQKKLFDSDRFEHKQGYDEMFELLIYLHDPMKGWQKDGHVAGNADDQVVVAAILYGVNELQTVNVFSNDAALNKTLLSFHKLLSSREMVPSDRLPVVMALRELDVLINQFNPQSGLFECIGKTIDFSPPYKYDFKEDMRLYFWKGSEEGSRSHTAAQRKIKEKTQTFLHRYNSVLANAQKAKQRTTQKPEPEPVVTEEEPRLKKELEVFSSKLPGPQPRVPTQTEPEQAETEPLETEQLEAEQLETEQPQEESILLQEPLEQLISKLDTNIRTLEQLEQAENVYQACRQAVEETLSKLEDKETSLASIRGVLEKIEQKKTEISEMSANIDGPETARKISELGNDITSLYEQLELLQK